MRSVLFHMYKYLNGSQKRLEYIRKIQHFNKNELTAYRATRLSELVLYCQQHIPYYTDMIKKTGIIEKGEFCFEKFTDLPMLTKSDIRNNFELLKSSEIDKRLWRYKTTGGSTGEPLLVIHDAERTKWVNAIKDLRNEWSGVAPGDLKIKLWGSERDLFYGKETLKTRTLRWLTNSIWLNAFRLERKKMFEFVHIINEKKPAHIKAYTTCLYEFARFIDENKLPIHSPRSIVCSAGTLTPAMRSMIDKVFMCPIFNSYGSREIQAMAFECSRHNGLHVLFPHLHFEIIDKNGNPSPEGEIGEVVLTPYFNFAMPLLRYRIGDMATWSSETCECGCNWPLLENIDGRTTECFYTRQGRIVPPEFFIHLVGVVQNDGWIKKFQVIQEDYELIRIKIVKGDVPVDEGKIAQNLSDLEKKIHVVMSEQCRIKFDFVTEIPNSASGKYLYTLSRINNF